MDDDSTAPVDKSDAEDAMFAGVSDFQETMDAAESM